MRCAVLYYISSANKTPPVSFYAVPAAFEFIFDFML